MGRTRAGFSLAEILAVVLVLSIVAAVAIPNLSATDPNKLELASQEFAQAIRFARAESLTRAPTYRGTCNARRSRGTRESVARATSERTMGDDQRPPVARGVGC